MKTPGFGLGLRPDHYDTIFSERPSAGSFEALTENYLVPGEGASLSGASRSAALTMHTCWERAPAILNGDN